MPRAGAMDREIVIQRATQTVDSIGHPILTWAALYSVWAQVIPVSGSEALRAGRDVSSRVARFLIRHISGLTARDRISYDSLYWDILNLRELGRRDGLEITAQVAE